MIAPKTADQKPGVPGPRGRQADRRDETAGRRDLAFSTAAPRFEDGTRWAHIRPGPTSACLFACAPFCPDGHRGVTPPARPELPHQPNRPEAGCFPPWPGPVNRASMSYRWGCVDARREPGPRGDRWAARSPSSSREVISLPAVFYHAVHPARNERRQGRIALPSIAGAPCLPLLSDRPSRWQF